MGKRRGKLEEYLEALEALANLFASGVPPRETLGHALGREEGLRAGVSGLEAAERACWALECGIACGLYVEYAVELASEGRLQDAGRLTRLLDFLFEDEAGIPEQVVRALTGRLDEATERLVELAQDRDRPPQARRNAVTALERIGDVERHVCCGFELVREFSGAQDYLNACHAAYDVAETLQLLAEESQAAWGPPGGGPSLLN